MLFSARVLNPQQWSCFSTVVIFIIIIFYCLKKMKLQIKQFVYMFYYSQLIVIYFKLAYKFCILCISFIFFWHTNNSYIIFLNIGICSDSITYEITVHSIVAMYIVHLEFHPLLPDQHPYSSLRLFAIWFNQSWYDY